MCLCICVVYLCVFLCGQILPIDFGEPAEEDEVAPAGVSAEGGVFGGDGVGVDRDGYGIGMGRAEVRVSLA